MVSIYLRFLRRKEVQDAIDKVAKAEQDMINTVSSVQASTNDMLNTLSNEIHSKSSLIFVGSGTISYSATLALLVGTRPITFSCPGTKPTDKLLVVPSSNIPAGYNIGPSISSTIDTVTTQVTHPILALGASFNIPVSVWAIR